MNHRFHAQALALLPEKERMGLKHAASTVGRNALLMEWAREHALGLPAAFVEWAQFDPEGALLRKYSNGDRFRMQKPKLVELDGIGVGLSFMSENQNNFDLVIALEQGDDPPVYFGWIGRAPWTRYADTFSDAVFAQLFDWQYRLEFRSESPDEGFVTTYGHFSCRDMSPVLSTLRAGFPTLTETRFEIEGSNYQQSRFFGPRVSEPADPLLSEAPHSRIVATVVNGTGGGIEVFAPNGQTDQVEAELLSAFSEYIEPELFSSPRNLLHRVSRLAKKRAWVQLKHLCEYHPDDSALEALYQCELASPLRDREIPDERGKSKLVIGSAEWGVEIAVHEVSRHRWKVVNIRCANL